MKNSRLASLVLLGVEVSNHCMSAARRALKKMTEWVVIVYDKPGTDRTAIRPEHLAAIAPAVEKGIIKNVGAIFHDKPRPEEGYMPFAGSSYNVVAENKEEIIEFLKQDPFAKAGIWDLDNVIAFPWIPSINKVFGSTPSSAACLVNSSYKSKTATLVSAAIDFSTLTYSKFRSLVLCPASGVYLSNPSHTTALWYAGVTKMTLISAANNWSTISVMFSAYSSRPTACGPPTEASLVPKKTNRILIFAESGTVSCSAFKINGKILAANLELYPE